MGNLYPHLIYFQTLKSNPFWTAALCFFPALSSHQKLGLNTQVLLAAANEKDKHSVGAWHSFPTGVAETSKNSVKRVCIERTSIPLLSATALIQIRSYLQLLFKI